MTTKDKEIIIIGVGGHGRVVLDLCRSLGKNVRGFIDKELPKGHLVNGETVLGNDDLLLYESYLKNYKYVVAIGNQQIKRRISLDIIKRNGFLETLIHKNASVSDTVTIGEGTVLISGSVVNANASIGRFCIVNTNSSIDHDCILEDGVQVCPGANLAGEVHCEEDVFIGTGAVVIPGVRIGARAIVGAGATVINDVQSDVTVASVPASVIKKKQSA